MYLVGLSIGAAVVALILIAIRRSKRAASRRLVSMQRLAEVFGGRLEGPEKVEMRLGKFRGDWVPGWSVDHVVEWTRGGLLYRLKVGRKRVELQVVPPYAARGSVLIKAGFPSQAITPGLPAPAPEQSLMPYPLELRSEPGLACADFLTERVRKNLSAICSLDYAVGLRFEVGVEGMLLRKDSGLKDEPTLRFFLNLALPVVAQAAISLFDKGVEFVEQTEMTIGECQICGHALIAPLVRCVKCGTTHHQDCWAYAAVCSTYGCGGTRSQRPLET